MTLTLRRSRRSHRLADPRSSHIYDLSTLTLSEGESPDTLTHLVETPHQTIKSPYELEHSKVWTAPKLCLSSETNNKYSRKFSRKRTKRETSRRILSRSSTKSSCRRRTCIESSKASAASARMLLSSTSGSSMRVEKEEANEDYENLALICARFIINLFCPVPSETSTSTVQDIQYTFIKHLLVSVKQPIPVTIAALIYLHRLKLRFPEAKGCNINRLFIAAYVLANKILCDDTFKNKAWASACMGVFRLVELNKMEKELCEYLDWDLQVDGTMLHRFEGLVRKDFGSSERKYVVYPEEIISRRTRAFKNAVSEPLREHDIHESDEIQEFNNTSLAFMLSEMAIFPPRRNTFAQVQPSRW